MNQITLSDRARSEIIKLIEKENLSQEKAGLRFGLKAGGCSGFEYHCELAKEADKYDEVFNFDGVKVFVDKKSLLFANGTHIDYKRALMGAGFQFNNPNATGTCGCGTSFAV